MSDVPEMVEKVARAIYEADRAAWMNDFMNQTPIEWDQAEVEVKWHYLATARTAIAAMAEPTEAMWRGLARQIVMWMCMRGQPTGKALHDHLRFGGRSVPEWLSKEIRNIEHVPPMGAMAVAIYRAQIDAALGNPPVAR